MAPLRREGTAGTVWGARDRQKDPTRAWSLKQEGYWDRFVEITDFMCLLLDVKLGQFVFFFSSQYSAASLPSSYFFRT